MAESDIVAARNRFLSVYLSSYVISYAKERPGMTMRESLIALLDAAEELEGMWPLYFRPGGPKGAA